MPKHIQRLLTLMAIALVGAIAGKLLFTPDSFYAYGHYRGASVAEIASEKPKYKGSDFCQACHAERYAEWAKGVHHGVDKGKVVQCEVCHTAAGGRSPQTGFDYVTTGIDHPASGKLPIPKDTAKLCTLCHEKMAGRPAEQRQIEVASHAGSQPCTACHNPHSPRIILGVATSARAEGASAGPGSCAACHGANGISSNPAWPILAGQKNAYLVAALKEYQSGARDNAMMAAIAKGMSEADMKKLAEHYAALKRGAVIAGATGKDSEAAKEKAAACASCHGADGVGKNPAWPTLAGQHKDFLVAALKAYRSGTRKSDLMSDIAADLSDADIQVLAAYYASVGSR